MQENTGFVDHLDRLADTIGEKTAIEFRGTSITWAGLRARARRNGSGLRASGEIGTRVAYLGMNHPACLETVYGALYAGRVVAIINWRLSPEEIAFARPGFHRIALNHAIAVFSAIAGLNQRQQNAL